MQNWMLRESRTHYGVHVANVWYVNVYFIVLMLWYLMCRRANAAKLQPSFHAAAAIVDKLVVASRLYPVTGCNSRLLRLRGLS